MFSWPRRVLTVVVLGLLVVALLPASSTQLAAAQSPTTCNWPAGWSRITSRTDPRQRIRASFASYGIAEAWIPASRLYSSDVYGVHASDDCGVAWKRMFGFPDSVNAATLAYAVAADPDGRIFTTSEGYQVHTIYLSEDLGISWRELYDGQRVLPINRGGLSVSAAGRVYARTSSSSRVQNADGLAYSDDGGTTWNLRLNQQWLPGQVVADPAERTALYAVGPLMYAAEPGASPPGIPRERYPHPPPYQLVQSVDSGVTFEPWSSVDELPGALAVSVDGSRFWFASYNQHLWQSRDQGQSWQIMDAMPFSDPKQLAVSPYDPRVLYAASDDGYLWVYREPEAAPAQLP